jgi:hypothetical protein
MSREKRAVAIRNAIIKLVKDGGGLSANEIRVIVALERIVARLSVDPTLDAHLVYKGGFVLLKTLGSNRFTRDLDALGVDLDKAKIAELVPMALVRDLDDGFWFGEIRVEDLDAQGEYGALRFDCAYQIGDPPTKKEAIKKLSRIHFDVGFGDELTADLKRAAMPSLLPAESKTSWRVYPPEFIFSEKLQTLIGRKSANSRSKDIHDIGILFDKCDPKKMLAAIEKTFARRKTELPISFLEFAGDLDTRLLAASWSSVKVAGEGQTFEEAWNLLKFHLAKIDNALAKRR